MSSLSRLNVETISWQRDWLPEHLWIASLIDTYGERRATRYFNRFMDAIDDYVVLPNHGVGLGLMSDFGAVPEERRKEFVEANHDLVLEGFHRPVGRVIAFYPECPANWLVLHGELSREPRLDPVMELGDRLSRFVMTLMPAKDLAAGHVRVMPAIRLVKHQRVQFPIGNTQIDDELENLTKYPDDCTEEEKYRAQQFCRTMINVVIGQTKHLAEGTWARYFWRQNWNLVECKPLDGSAWMGEVMTDDAPRSLNQVLEHNASATYQYIEALAKSVKIDLYNPTRDEVLLGLLSRSARLYVLMLRHTDLWSRDLAGVVLRCLADSAIVFAHFAINGTEIEFSACRRYGEGKEKVLMLHLQDSYLDGRSLDDETSEDIAENLGGGMAPELLDIELDNWTKKSMRDLTISTGLERIYRLVYDPASADIHGTWTSLKRSNLVYCAEPLHRFHRLPSVFAPPLLANVIAAAQEMIATVAQIAKNHLGYPELPTQFIELPGFTRSSEAAGSVEAST